MNLSDNKSLYEYCLTKKTVGLIHDANQGCLSDDKLGTTVLLNNQFQSMLQFEPVGTELTAGYVSIATFDFTSYATFGDLTGAVIIDGANIATLPEGNYPNITSLLNALADAINNNSTLYTAANQGSSIFTISVVTPGTTLNDTEVTIVINPTFFATETLLAGTGGYMMVVNEPASSFYGKLIYGGKAGASFLTNYIRVFDNGTEMTAFSPITYPQSSFAGGVNGFPYSLSSQLIAYNSDDDQFLITGSTYGKYTFMDSSYALTYNPSYPTVPDLYFSATLPAFVVWNPVNSTYYWATSSGVRYYVAPFTVPLALGGMTNATRLTVNTDTGDVWICADGNVYVMDTSNALVSTIVAPAGATPRDITYVPSQNRMYVVYWISAAPATSFVRSYNATSFAVVAASFYALNIDGNSCAIYYSNIFNVIFVNTIVATVLHTDILSIAGVLRDSIPITGKSLNISFADDVKNNKVWALSFDNTPTETSTVLRYFELGSEGDETIEAAFYGGVDPTYSDGTGNCITQSLVNSGIQKLNRECNQCSPEMTPQTIPPSGLTYTIYYGANIAQGVNAATIGAMPTYVASSYIADYVFGFLTPSQFRYVAIPALLGTPTSFTDPSTGFPIALATTYQVTINSIIYNVFQSFYALGGAITFRVT